MKLHARWMWSVVFCLSALAFAEEADALRVDKVYKVLFVSNGFPAFGTELAEITNNLGEALPEQ